MSVFIEEPDLAMLTGIPSTSILFFYKCISSGSRFDGLVDAGIKEREQLAWRETH